MIDMKLPPSITLKPTVVDVEVLNVGGVSVEVRLPRPRSLDSLAPAQMVEQARRAARQALLQAAETLEQA